MADDNQQERQANALRRAAALVTEAMDVLDAHGLSPISAAYLAIALKAIQEDLAN